MIEQKVAKITAIGLSKVLHSTPLDVAHAARMADRVVEALHATRPEIPQGALQQAEPFHTIGRKWIAYAQRENDSNVTRVAWRAWQASPKEQAVTTEVNISRMAACVKACEGIATEDLADGVATYKQVTDVFKRAT